MGLASVGRGRLEQLGPALPMPPVLLTLAGAMLVGGP